MKITAAVLDQIGRFGPFADTRPLRLAELDLAPPLAGELLVRIEAAGLCHSDLSVINGDRPADADGDRSRGRGDRDRGRRSRGGRSGRRRPRRAVLPAGMRALPGVRGGRGADINGPLDELASGRAIRQIVIPDASAA